jgi:hypothetical protein
VQLGPPSAMLSVRYRTFAILMFVTSNARGS